MLKPNKLVSNNFLSSLDTSSEEVYHILEIAKNFKNKDLDIKFKDKVLGLIFDKSSTRTRVSFQVAMSRLGGTTVDLNPSRSQIGRGEPIKDTARVLSRYCDALAIRTFNQSTLEDYARWSTKPVINALTDHEHPCQALADFLTIQEEFNNFDNVVLTFIGDGNNVANSIILCGSLLGVEVRIACPKGYEPNSLIVKKAYEIYKNKDLLKITNDPNSAVLGANVLYTDVWSSMGEENQKEKKDKLFHGFTIDGDLVSTWSQHSSNPNKPLSKDGMRDIIRQERMIELALEGHRYWDLRRWKLAEEFFSKPIRGWNIFRPDVEGFYEVENIYYRNFLKKDYLWPISQNELLRNPNLIQNPGW